MQFGAARGNGDGVSCVRAEHIARRGGEFRQHQRRRIGGSRLEMLPRRDEGSSEGRRQREPAEACFERLQAAPVVFRAHGGGGK
jgi:hypothetical protein